jgi:hypothetical protein
MNRTLAAALSLFFINAAIAAGPACTAHSGATTVPLVEVYTSEGCSSCPPAEHWLSADFPARPRDNSAVALAFHVDYWDQDGWRDRYSSRAYTDRQQQVAEANGASFVFTPQVVLQGRNAGEWAVPGKFDAELVQARTEPAAADIALTVRGGPDGYAVDATAQLVGHVPGKRINSNTRLYVALADSGHDVDVHAGENRGVKLHHDHVVRALSAGAVVDAQGRAQLSTHIALPADAGTAPTVVAFVQDTEKGTVLQTLALPVTDCSSAP